MEPSQQYSEWHVPRFNVVTFWLPMFWYYYVEVENDTLSFGYGPSAGLCSKSLPIQNIRAGSVLVGTTNWKDNLTNFGGWGIRNAGDLWNYNPSNGGWVQFQETAEAGGGRYRFYSENPTQVARLLSSDADPLVS